MKNLEAPCKKCLCLAPCKTRVERENMVTLDFVWECSILDKYLFPTEMLSMEEYSRREREIYKIMKVKYDFKPMY